MPLAARNQSGPGAPRSRVDLPPIRLLIVEDEELNRRLISAYFPPPEYELAAVADAAEALRLFAQRPFDVVLMDLGLPGMDGAEATRAIKLLAGDRFVPVLMVTGQTDVGELERCFSMGADDFMQKPFERVVFTSKVNAAARTASLFERSRAQAALLHEQQQREQQELELAENVMGALMTGGCLDAPFINYVLSPLAVFNGDFVFAAPTHWGGVRWMLGDFAGHGLSAAIGAVPVAEIFNGAAAAATPLPEVIRQINAKLKDIMPVGLFCSAALLELDATRTRLSCWNGGLPAVLVHQGRGLVARLKSRSLPLGVVGNASFEVPIETVEVAEGMRIFVCSDGVTETSNHEGQMFGEERLELALTGDVEPDHLFGFVRSALNSFRAGGAETDDMTLVEVRVEAQQPSPPPRAREELHLKLDLSAELIREGDPVGRVMDLLCALPELRARRSQLFTVLAELITNAVDHGLLGLDSSIKAGEGGFAAYYEERARRLTHLLYGSVRVEAALRHTPSPKLWLRIEDGCAGFEPQDPARADVAPHGLGLTLVRGLCEELSFPGGSAVEATFVP